MFNPTPRYAALFAAFFLLLLLAGCTEMERSGYSSIPQNYPSSWETNPYPDLQN